MLPKVPIQPHLKHASTPINAVSTLLFKAVEALALLRAELQRRRIVTSEFMRSADGDRNDGIVLGELGLGLESIGIGLDGEVLACSDAV